MGCGKRVFRVLVGEEGEAVREMEECYAVLYLGDEGELVRDGLEVVGRGR